MNTNNNPINPSYPLNCQDLVFQVMLIKSIQNSFFS